ncbi:MAG: S-layer protein [Candidatus Woesearchaeota archaeon]
MFIVNKQKNIVFSLPVKEIKPGMFKAIGSELALKILKTIAEKPSYPVEISKKLKVHEQKVYYHIRNLERAGFIKVISSKEIAGSIAKIYGVEKPAFFFKLKEFEQAQKIVQIRGESSFLEDFIKDGQLNARIIVGSPDPHGPEKARSRDGYYGIDLALFLGTFLNYVPGLNVKLDTEVKEEDLKQNLILIGGPVVNRVCEQINDKLPVRFSKDGNWNIYSSVSGKYYYGEENGIIVKAKNPFNKDANVFVIAGKRYSGTRAAIVAILKHFDKVTAGNIYNPKITAKIVEGIDYDSDGIVDDAEFLE